MSNENSVFQIFEGQCSGCGENGLEVRQVAGYPKFHQNYTFTEGEVVIWKGEPDDLDDIGTVGFDCPSCGLSIEVYAGAWGDWTASI